MPSLPATRKTMKISNHPAPLRDTHPIKALKTPEPLRRKARNWYRRKKGIPEDDPAKTRAEPFNKSRRGTGNVGGKVFMPPEAWEILDRLKGKLNRGEYIDLLLRENEIHRLETGTI